VVVLWGHVLCKAFAAGRIPDGTRQIDARRWTKKALLISI